MNLLITPMLVIGLLLSSSTPGAGECLADPTAVRTCENCASKVSAHDANDHLDRQARKHTQYYLTLQRAQQESGDEPAAAQQYYSARTNSTTLTESELQAQ